MRDPTSTAKRCGAALPCRTLIAGALVLLAACERAPPPPSPPPQQARELVALVRPGPATWFPGTDGEPSGFDHELLLRFAREQHLPLRVIMAPSAADLLGRLAAGEAQVGVGGLFQAASAKDEAPQSTDASQRVLWTAGIYAVEPTLIYNVDGFKPRSLADLERATVAFPAGTGLDSQLAAVRLAHPEVEWKAVDVPSSDALIAQVSEGSVDYAIVPSNDAAIARSAYLDFDVAFTVGPRRLLAWAVAPGQKDLRDALDVYFARLREDGTLARYAQRYFSPVGRVQRIDAEVFRERIKKSLPQFRRMFEDGQEASRIEWRLLAAVAYQESQWDPFATSETGVRGFMQLTDETARRLGVTDRLDTKASILGAARYLQDLRSKFPARITEPDRSWLALAAFNIGIAHLEDARILAQKQKLNPDLWSDVKKTLPLLAEPEYYENAKYGYARGGMPVAFVDRVRAYYDILLRTEPAYNPRLRLTFDVPEPAAK
jgi:membrane-bound lytic murein transglycosylase F